MTSVDLDNRLIMGPRLKTLVANDLDGILQQENVHKPNRVHKQQQQQQKHINRQNIKKKLEIKYKKRGHFRGPSDTHKPHTIALNKKSLSHDDSFTQKIIIKRQNPYFCPFLFINSSFFIGNLNKCYMPKINSKNLRETAQNPNSLSAYI